MYKLKIVWPIVLSVLVSSGVFADADPGEQLAAKSGSKLVGQLAPPLKFATLDGKSIDLAAFAGHKSVYLKFWATWCVPCRQQMPHLQHAYDALGKQMEVVAINLGLNDSEADVKAYRERLKLSVPMAIDATGNLAQSFDVSVTPLHVVIGRDGRIAYVGHNASSQLDEALKQAAKGESANINRPSHKLAIANSATTKVGMAAPDLSALLSPQKISSHKPIVVAFITVWCESYLKESRPTVSVACTKTRESMTQLSKTMHDKIEMIAVAGRVWTTAADVEEYRLKYSAEFPVKLDDDGKLFERYQVRNVPTVVVIDSHGIVRERIEEGRSDLKSAIERWTKP